jgi:hypothetical protein
MSTLTTHRLPAPTWHGFDDDAEHQFRAYVETYHREILAVTPREIEGRREANESARRSTVASINRINTSLGENRALVQAKTSELAKVVDTTILEEQLAEIKARPEVIGTRVDSDGTLVVHARIFVNRTDRMEGRRFVGDFELIFRTASETRYGHGARNAIFITTTRPGRVLSAPYYEYQYDHDTEIARAMVQLPRSPAELLKEGAFAQIVREAITTLRSTRPREEMSDAMAEPTWHGFIPDAMAAAACTRAITLGVKEPLRRELESLQRQIERESRDLQGLVDKMRSLNQEQARLSVELAAAYRALEESEPLDPEAIKSELIYICSLPGVMGMKFSPEGAPIIHVRTSFVYDDEVRYDLGDIEIDFTEGRGKLFRIALTRESRPERGRLYFHTDNWGGTGAGLVCFGSRGWEIDELKRSGNFGQFVHLMISTLNSINTGDQRKSKLDGLYRSLPLDAVWSEPTSRPWWSLKREA